MKLADDVSKQERLSVFPDLWSREKISKQLLVARTFLYGSQNFLVCHQAKVKRNRYQRHIPLEVANAFADIVDSSGQMSASSCLK